LRKTAAAGSDNITRKIMTSPQYQAKDQAIYIIDGEEDAEDMKIRRLRARIDYVLTQYDALLNSLNLNQERSDELTSLLVRRMYAIKESDANIGLGKTDLSVNTGSYGTMLSNYGDSSIFNEARRNAALSIDAEILALLGKDGYEMYSQYENAIPLFSIVVRLGELADAGKVPLTKEQENGMRNAILMDSSGREVMQFHPVTISNALIVASQSILDPAQVAHLVLLQARRQAQFEMVDAAIRQKREQTE
jgi:hypothetical protein